MNRPDFFNMKLTPYSIFEVAQLAPDEEEKEALEGMASDLATIRGLPVVNQEDEPKRSWRK